jgi:hypothetical protein
MESRRKVKDPDYEPPLDKVCGVICMLGTDEEVRRFVEAYGTEEDARRFIDASVIRSGSKQGDER